MTPQAYEPPEHLEESTRAWARAIVEAFEIEPHELRLLQSCCESWDRYQAARATLDDEGLTVNDRFGQAKLHPCVAVERDSRLAFTKCLRELNLDADTPEPPRPPRR